MDVLSFTFTIFLAIFFTCSPAYFAEVPQIKIVSTQTHYSNPKYNRHVVMVIKRHNETYNRVGVHWSLMQDIRADIQLGTKVYVTDKNYQNPKLIYKNVTPLCKPSKTHDWLPSSVVASTQLAPGTSCHKKGEIVFDDFGHFRFDIAVPNVEKLGTYYRIDYTIGSPYDAHFIASMYAEWGYLNSK